MVTCVSILFCIFQNIIYISLEKNEKSSDIFFIVICLLLQNLSKEGDYIFSNFRYKTCQQRDYNFIYFYYKTCQQRDYICICFRNVWRWWRWFRRCEMRHGSSGPRDVGLPCIGLRLLPWWCYECTWTGIFGLLGNSATAMLVLLSRCVLCNYSWLVDITLSML